MLKPKINADRWDIKREIGLFSSWTRKKIFKFNPNSKNKIFAIDTPPPYPSGTWHMGAAAHYSQIDMIARTARMMGFETYFPIGIDRNGIPVERYTERKFDIRMHETPREKFIELARTALDDLEAQMIRIMKLMGLSGDFENYYRTDNEDYRKLTQATFIELWNKGLIYEDTRPNNYCTDCGTTIADADIEYEERPTELIHLKFKLKETGEDIIIATTRPELLAACQAIIINPEDERYKTLKGKHATTPIYEKTIRIIAHPAAKKEFGTGIMMICSYGDYSDVRLIRELKLKEIIAIDIRGRMTRATGKYELLKIREARKQIIEDLERAGLITGKEKITHRTPICERSKTEIEIISMKEYYLKQLNFTKKIREIAKKLKFHPELHRQKLLDWIDSISIDWPISRRRYYGTEIPIWYCDSCRKPNLPKPGKYYQPWRDKAPFEKCKFCKKTKFTGDQRTFDTWFDSGISPLFISRYMSDKTFFKKTFPATLRPQAKEIIRTWLYYTLLRCYQLTGKSPFRHAWIMGYGIDEKGEKMSKSKGNIIDPLPIIEKYGGDSFRYWSASEASLGSDFMCSETRVIPAGKFLNKLWNISRFISMFPQTNTKKIAQTDKWILSELSKLIKECLDGYNDFNFFIPATKIREFTWNLFADHYIEMIKARAYGSGFTKGEQKSARFTLHTILKTILLLSAPIIPFLSEEIWSKLYSKKSIHQQEFPKHTFNMELTKLTKSLIEFNSKIWNMKKEKGMSLKDKIEIEIPKELQQFKKDLTAMHNISI